MLLQLKVVDFKGCGRSGVEDVELSENKVIPYAIPIDLCKFALVEGMPRVCYVNQSGKH